MVEFPVEKVVADLVEAIDNDDNEAQKKALIDLGVFFLDIFQRATLALEDIAKSQRMG